MSASLGILQLTAGTPQIFTAASDGVAGFVIANESGLTATISLEGCQMSKSLYPGTADSFMVTKGFTGNIKITTQSLLNNIGQWPSAYLQIDQYGTGEQMPTGLPLTLPRLVNQGNSATVPGSSTSIVNDGNAANTQILESTVAADGASAVRLTNDAILTLGTAAHHGSISAANGAFTVNGSGDATAHSLNASNGLTAAGGANIAGGATVAGGLTVSGGSSFDSVGLQVNSISRISIVACMPTIAGQTVNHGLGVKPDIMILQENDATHDLHKLAVDYSTANATNVKCYSDLLNGVTAKLISIAF